MGFRVWAFGKFYFILSSLISNSFVLFSLFYFYLIFYNKIPLATSYKLVKLAHPKLQLTCSYELFKTCLQIQLKKGNYTLDVFFTILCSMT